MLSSILRPKVLTFVLRRQMREMEILSTSSSAHSEVGGNGEAASSDPSLASASAAIALMQQRAAAAVAAYYPYPQAVIPSQARLSLRTTLIFC